MKRLRDDRGSVIVLVVLLMTALLAISAVAVDVGSWYTADRKLQSTADAAVLAGAQDLPNTTTAASSATSYANANNSGVDTWAPTFPDTSTIDVSLSKSIPSIFAKLVGINSKTVHAHARAQVGTPTQIRNVLPVGVAQSAVCTVGSSGCFGASKLLRFDDTTTVSFSSSTWGLMDLLGGSTSTSNCQGQASSSQIQDWISNGYQGLLSVNQYYGAVNGEKSTQNALNTQIGKPLLVPVYDSASTSWCKNPAKGGFHIVGWAALVIDNTVTNSDWGPHVKQLHIHFVEYIVHDVDSTPGYSGFGVKVIQLTQ
jgi:hypothetical protein